MKLSGSTVWSAGAVLLLITSACDGDRKGAPGSPGPSMEAGVSAGGAGSSDAAPGTGGASPGNGGAPSGTGGVEVCADGGMTPPARRLASAQNAVYLAADDTNVYWSAPYSDPSGGTPSGNLVKLPRGGVPVLLTAIRGQYSGRIALRGTNLYFLTGGASNHGTVQRISTAGGTAVEMASTESNPQAIAADAAAVYWANAGTLWGDAGDVPIDYANGTIMKVPASGGTPTTLASGLRLPHAIAIDGAYVYFVAYMDDSGIDGAPWQRGVVARVPLDGGSVGILATGERCPQDVAVGGAYVYWTTSCDEYDASGEVRRVPFAGGAATTIATGQRRPYGILVTGDSIFWTNSGRCGSVMRAALDGSQASAISWGDVGGPAFSAGSVLWSTLDGLFASGGQWALPAPEDAGADGSPPKPLDGSADPPPSRDASVD